MAGGPGRSRHVERSHLSGKEGACASCYCSSSSPSHSTAVFKIVLPPFLGVVYIVKAAATYQYMLIVPVTVLRPMFSDLIYNECSHGKRLGREYSNVYTNVHHVMVLACARVVQLLALHCQHKPPCTPARRASSCGRCCRRRFFCRTPFPRESPKRADMGHALLSLFRGKTILVVNRTKYCL